MLSSKLVINAFHTCVIIARCCPVLILLAIQVGVFFASSADPRARTSKLSTRPPHSTHHNVPHLLPQSIRPDFAHSPYHTLLRPIFLSSPPARPHGSDPHPTQSQAPPSDTVIHISISPLHSSRSTLMPSTRKLSIVEKNKTLLSAAGIFGASITFEIQTLRTISPVLHKSRETACGESVANVRPPSRSLPTTTLPKSVKQDFSAQPENPDSWPNTIPDFQSRMTPPIRAVVRKQITNTDPPQSTGYAPQSGRHHRHPDPVKTSSIYPHSIPRPQRVMTHGSSTANC